MGVTRFRREMLVPVPWKNGGGVTHEVACVPAGAGTDGFDWRASIARIERDGPFSAFPGIDRSIVLLDGGGVQLARADGGWQHRLAEPMAPFTFDGDDAVHACLLAGPSSDFNVMTRRGRCRAVVQAHREALALPPAPGGVLLAVAGRWQVYPAGPALAAGDGLWWHDEPQAWHLSPVTGDAMLLSVQILPTEDTP